MKTKGEWTAESKREWDTVVKKYVEAATGYSIKTLILKAIDDVNFFIVKYRMPKSVPADKRKAYYVYTDYSGLVGIRPKAAGFRKFAESVLKKTETRKKEHKLFRGIKGWKELTERQVLNVADYVMFKKGMEDRAIGKELKAIAKSPKKMTYYRAHWKKLGDRARYEITKLYKWKPKKLKD